MPSKNIKCLLAVQKKADVRWDRTVAAMTSFKNNFKCFKSFYIIQHNQTLQPKIYSTAAVSLPLVSVSDSSASAGIDLLCSLCPLVTHEADALSV